MLDVSRITVVHPQSSFKFPPSGKYHLTLMAYHVRLMSGYIIILSAWFC